MAKRGTGLTGFAVPAPIPALRHAGNSWSTTRSSRERTKHESLQTNRRKRATTPDLIRNRRESRLKYSDTKYALVAKWGGVVVAESVEYEVSHRDDEPVATSVLCIGCKTNLLF
jgi:hypothetical protein